ncbi:substrate-binding periplasmic protein [Colwellia sp. MEBiC06753]
MQAVNRAVNLVKISLLTCMLLPTTLTAEELKPQALTFMVNTDGSPPYIYKNKDNHFTGAVPELLAMLPQYSINYVEYNRKRGEMALYQGKFDLALSAKAWLSQPEKFSFSLPVAQHKSFLFSKQPFSDNFSLSELPKNAEICTRRLYQYPNLEDKFANQQFMRIDSPSQTTQVQMLLANRCQYAVLNEHIAEHLFSELTSSSIKVFRSPVITSQVDQVIVIQPQFHQFKQDLDQLILSLNGQGKLEQLINKHTPKQPVVIHSGFN